MGITITDTPIERFSIKGDELHIRTLDGRILILMYGGTHDGKVITLIREVLPK